MEIKYLYLLVGILGGGFLSIIILLIAINFGRNKGGDKHIGQLEKYWKLNNELNKIRNKKLHRIAKELRRISHNKNE